MAGPGTCIHLLWGSVCVVPTLHTVPEKSEGLNPVTPVLVPALSQMAGNGDRGAKPSTMFSTDFPHNQNVIKYQKRPVAQYAITAEPLRETRPRHVGQDLAGTSSHVVVTIACLRAQAASGWYKLEARTLQSFPAVQSLMEKLLLQHVYQRCV
ncbi:hypothetical protein LX36DRAFT_665669 [Colletotrichum falcatum]|nr:hypothetical protein LX36DRAFT_665669 [Colletotrichum falcatum]